mmetsp:Transcript_36758/g.101094  ORF Transcript_36758/g.101094 Transcript_36758/m.101094 type:complete len:380 (-) Transcript_36758:37-1176(-)
MRDVDEEVRHVIGVVGLHHGEEHRVADAVRRMVEAAELVGHGVHVAQAGGVEGHARQELRVGHHVAGFHVLAVLHRLRQEGGNELNGMQRIGVRDWVGRRAHIGLNGVRQRVHASSRCQALGHPHHKQRIVHRQSGREAPIHEGHLDVALVVSDDAEPRHLCCRARRGVHRHHGQHGLGALVHALVVLDAAAIGGQHADGLGTVVRGATTERNDKVATILLEQLDAGIDLLNCGVGSATIVYSIGHSSAIQHICKGPHCTDLHEDCVGDDERFLLAEGLHLVDCPHQGPLSQYRLAGHEESAAFLTGRWVVVVHTVGALSGVASKVLLNFTSQLAAGNRFVDGLHISRLRWQRRGRAAKNAFHCCWIVRKGTAGAVLGK